MASCDHSLNPRRERENDTAARSIFSSAWQSLAAEFSPDGLDFPREIFWLNGAPGAGKGTHTTTILQHLRCLDEPIVISDLLKSPYARKIMDAGQLVGDFEVLSLLLRKLIEPQFRRQSIIVDGFPRTQAQVEFLRIFYEKLTAMNARRGYPAPRFNILILLVDEEESVRRQMKRGNEAQTANATGNSCTVRKTDLDPKLARNRYHVFMQETCAPLQTLRDAFPLHIVNSTGSIAEVSQRIVSVLPLPPS
ncbi:MAG: nucleoside monophosphate kinase [Puniceicoccales bacterium]|jgi:adenylate kinase|nr:nucleoside monophosphate kinase [Puniceicoccales bacterium]